MKKLMFIICVIGISVLMSSCLKEGDRSFSGNYLAYVTQDKTSNTIFARAFGYQAGGSLYYQGAMASPKLKDHRPGYWAFIGCSWSEQNGMLEGSNGTIYNVQMTSDPVILPSSVLHLEAVPVIEKPISFLLMNPIYDQKVKDNLFDNKWLFPYQCKIKKGEEAVLEFYFDSKKAENKKDEITIDIILEKKGTATGTTEELKQHYTYVDFSLLRDKLNEVGGYNNQISVKFRFHKEGVSDPKPYISQGTLWYLKD